MVRFVHGFYVQDLIAADSLKHHSKIQYWKLQAAALLIISTNEHCGSCSERAKRSEGEMLLLLATGFNSREL
jgi:hypothetical protein